MADDTLPLTPESAPEPTQPSVPEPAETPSEPTPLDQAPLSEFVKRRAKGETATDTPADDSTSTESDSDQAAKPSKPGDGKAVPKTRFDQIYRQRSDAIRERDAEKARTAQLEAEIQQLKQQRQLAQPTEQPPQAPTSPNLDQYLAAGKTYEDWMDARIEWQAQRIADARIAADRQLTTQQAAEAERLQQIAGLAERTEAAKTKYADYDEKVIGNDRVKLSPVMTDIVTRSPNGPDIMYWLGTHEAEANKLGEQSRQYGPAAYPLMEAHLLLLSGQSAPPTGAKKAVPVSNAPAPISPVGGGSSTTTVALDQMSLGDYVKRRNAADLKKRTG